MKNAALVSVVALATASALFTGCKRPVEKADEDVAAAISKGAQAMEDKPNASTALPTLSGAANNKTASDPSQSSANLIAGQAELQAADAVIVKLDDGQLKIGHLVGRINELAARVQANNVAVAGLVAQDPKTTLAAITQEVTSAKGGDKATWTISKTDTILPTLDAAEKSIADLTKQIADLKAKHEDLFKQQNAALQEADKLAQQSEQEAGKKSVDLFKQSADLKKTGAELANQIITTDATAAGLERDLAVAQAEQKQLKSAVDKLDDQAKQVTGGWSDVQKKIEEYTASSKAIVEGAGDAAPAATPGAQPQITSIKQAGDELEQTAAAVAKLRDEALAHLDKANSYFGAADRVNQKVTKEYLGYLRENTTSPIKQAWEWMVEIHNSSDPDLQRAQVQQRMARVFADQAWYADIRLKSATALKDVLAKVTVDVPKSLEAGALDKEINDARAKASQAFVDAEKLLETIIDYPPTPGGGKTIPALKQAGKVAMMAEQYARWAYTKAAGDEKKEFLEAAKKLAGDLALESVPLPTPLPPEIAPPSTATPLPTVPTTGPTIPGTADAATPGGGSDTLDQAEVRKVYVAFEKALDAGDATSAKALAASDAPMVAEIDLAVAARSTARKLGAALGAKFGAEAKSLTDRLAADAAKYMQKVQTAQIVMSGDTASVKDEPNDETPTSMKKVDGAWKIVAPPGNAKHDAEMQKLAKETAAYQSVTADIESGKIAAFADLPAAIVRAKAAAGLPPTGAETAPAAPDATVPAAPTTKPVNDSAKPDTAKPDAASNPAPGK